MKTSRREFMGALSASMLAIGSGANLLANGTSTETPDSTPTKPTRPTLKFHDGEFKILQLTDLHLKYIDEEHTDHHGDGYQVHPKYINEGHIDRATATLQIAHDLTVQEKPDLVILTGDIVSNEPTALPGGVEEAWNRVGAVFSDLSVPYGITYGNHDHERRESAAEMMAMIEKNPWNVTTSDDPSISGAGNTVLPVLASDGITPRWNLWLFDSHSYPIIPGKNGDYDWIKNDQIQWYRKTSEALNANLDAPLPSLAFFHIPLPEYNIVANQSDKLGVMNEEICSPELNSGLFTSFLEKNDVLGVFTGHDHDNDFIGVYKNVALAYGRKTGVDTYGSLPLGGRVIILKEDEKGFDTYVTTPEERTLDYTFRRS